MRWWLSDRDGGARLAEQPPLTPCADEAGPLLWVDPTRRFQVLEGFGGAFTEAAATVWSALPEPVREQVLKDLFSQAEGHGYTLCRVHINSCDFSLGHYAHADIADDFALEHFSIARDRQALLPFIQSALRVAGRPIKLLASPWSPPAWMKTNGRMDQGGSLRPECRAVWAQCFVRFIQAYAAEGVPIWGVTVQNEPMATQRWDSCIYSAEEERDFVRDHLGPALHAAGLGHVKIVIWDHNRDAMVERASVVYGDARAAQYVWGTGFHWYGEDHFDHVQLVHDAWPDKALLFTEGCQEGGPHPGSWNVAERYARSLINDLNRWAVGWIDWNLLLDAHGGPNHVGNLCSAPLLADAALGSVQHQPSFAVLGHFARFVAPRARRVLCASSTQEIDTTAFVDDNGRVTVVASHPRDHAVSFRLNIAGQCWHAPLPPRSIATYVATQ